MVKNCGATPKAIVVLFTLLICAFTSFQFLTPLLIDENSIVIIQDLNGNNFRIHKGDIAVPYLLIYDIGKLICHQNSQRSLEINGNQMPICLRCLGILLGVNCSLILSIVICTNIQLPQHLIANSVNSFSSVVHLKKREISAIVIFGLSLTLPMIFDGLLQIFTSYESSSTMRLATGFLFGVAEGLVLVGLVVSVFAFGKKT